MDFRSKGISVDGKLFENQLYFINWILVVVVQLLSHVWLFPTPWTAAWQASQSINSNSCPLNWWCHPTISSSIILFSSCPQSLPASGSFQISHFFTSGGQSIGASASASVLPVNVQGWLPLGWTGLTSFLSEGLSSIFSSITIWKN